MGQLDVVWIGHLTMAVPKRVLFLVVAGFVAESLAVFHITDKLSGIKDKFQTDDSGKAKNVNSLKELALTDPFQVKQ